MPSWSHVGAWILDHPRLQLAVLLVLSVFLGYGALQVHTDHTAGHFLAEDSETVQDFRRANALFGQSQAILYVVVQETDLFAPAFLARLDSLTRAVQAMQGVEQVLSLTNTPYLVRVGQRLEPRPLYAASLPADSLRQRFTAQPFLHGLLLNDEATATALLVRINPVFNDTPARVDLVKAIEAAARRLPGRTALAGFPYLRTQYAERVTAEAPFFTFLALLLSLAFLFATFRSFRAVVLPMAIVLLGTMWTVGLMGWFKQPLNIVTAILPALIVVIGMANAIHLITKYLDLYYTLHDRRQALIETVRTVGLATLLTCLTTAIGFWVLVLSGSRLLTVFGLFAGAGVMMLYVLSITLIPLAFYHARPPSERTAGLVTHDRFADAFERLASLIRRRNTLILGVSLLLGLAGIYGATRISTDIFVFSDFYEDDPLREDLARFEAAFGGVLPLEVIIEARQEGAFRSLSNLRRLEQFERQVASFDAVGETLAMTDLVKLANQAYFGGRPGAFRLPSGLELPLLQSALVNMQRDGGGHLDERLPRFADTTLTMTRVYAGVHDIGTSAMNSLADSVRARAAVLFPPERFDVTVTGTAIVSTRSGENLVRNLILSLAVALLVISVLMALLFRSARLTFISLLPNVIPLLMVGGAMGYFHVALKPSTALIFSLAFGIAVDDTIHFLSKYRLLRLAGYTRDAAIRKTLRETGKAILFTSLVLMAGFLVFTLSSFGGTVAMGALTALTLAAALVANLFLLPALMYRFGPLRAQDHHAAEAPDSPG